MLSNKPLRALLLALAGLALLAGLWTGLLRIGWNWSGLLYLAPVGHGPLMVSGFLGTLILLERAVAIARRWAYLGVAVNGLGGLLIVSGVGRPGGALLLTAGSLWLVLVVLYILRRQPALHTAAMTAGAACWLAGNFLWLFGEPFYLVVLWWAAFLVLTIAGERLELSRATRLSAAAHRLFMASCLCLVGGLAIQYLSPAIGWRLAGLAFLALALWLLLFDIARRTLRVGGLPRYIAWCLLLGYGWLGIGGLAGLLSGPQAAGVRYDFILHAIFVGFVIGMVFGHAPILLPAILGASLHYTRLFYLPLMLLHASLLLRLLGDVAGVHAWRAWGGLSNALAILVFLATVAASRFYASRGVVAQG